MYRVIKKRSQAKNDVERRRTRSTKVMMDDGVKKNSHREELFLNKFTREERVSSFRFQASSIRLTNASRNLNMEARNCNSSCNSIIHHHSRIYNYWRRTHRSTQMAAMDEVVIISGCRKPEGKLQGSLSE